MYRLIKKRLNVKIFKATRSEGVSDCSVIIPLRENDSSLETVSSLSAGIIIPKYIVEARDLGLGANFARMRGYKVAKNYLCENMPSLLLFSDNDILWHKESIAIMDKALEKHKEVDVVYGHYDRGYETVGKRPFSLDVLKRMNYITMMSMMREKAFTCFDQCLKRLQDWDLWLSMALNGSKFMYLPKKLFWTKRDYKKGLSGQGIASYEEARDYIRDKWRLEKQEEDKVESN